MGRIFIDSDFLIALNDTSDLLYQDALKILEKGGNFDLKLVCSTNILLETVTVISQRIGKNKAVSLLNKLRSPQYTIIHPNKDDIFNAENIFKTIKSKNVSYSDCLSFSIMKAHAINWVCSFDIHFKKQGFKRFILDGTPNFSS